jgi:hypothetical protein
METKLKKTNNKYCSQIKIGLKHPAYVTFRLTPTDGIHFREPYRRLHSLSILPARFASLLLQRTQQKSISWPTTKGCVLPCRALQRRSRAAGSAARRPRSYGGALHRDQGSSILHALLPQIHFASLVCMSDWRRCLLLQYHRAIHSGFASPAAFPVGVSLRAGTIRPSQLGISLILLYLR